MAYITPIGSNPAQINYRLDGGHGCGNTSNDHQFSYHADGRERPLRWIGRGLHALGIQAGAELTPDQFNAARALMQGLDPRTGEVLVEAKRAVPDDAKISLAPLVRAVHAVAAEAGVPVAEVLGDRVKLVEEFARAERAVARKGEAARLRADAAAALAEAADLTVEDIWGQDVYDTAAANLWEIREFVGEDGQIQTRRDPRRVIVGNAGYDVTLTLPKSFSLLLAFADEAISAEIEQIYLQQVHTAFGWLEASTAYGMRGQHGNGKQAATVAGDGFLGWTMIHRAARPVDGAEVGDPHWHVHITVANMTRGEDGNWSTVAAGGRDLMRHVAALDHILKAQVRHELTRRYGIIFDRNPRTGAWEIVGIPDDSLRQFSKRNHAIKQMLTTLGYDADTASRAESRIAEQRSRGAKGESVAAADATLQHIWQGEELDAGRDPADHIARVFNGGADPNPGTPAPTPPPSPAASGTASPPPSTGLVTAAAAAAVRGRAGAAVAPELTAAQIARQLLHPDTGLTAHSRRFTRADALMRVADAMPEGFATPADVEQMTDAVLSHGGFVQLPLYGADNDAPADLHGPNGAGPSLAEAHMRNAKTYTTTDVVDAEKVILRAAKAAAENPHASPVRVIDRDRIELAIETVEAQLGFPLVDEQRAALARLVTGGRMIDTVNGVPGSGKTTLMRAVRVLLESSGYIVRGTTTAAVAGRNLETESGIHADTVAALVHALKQRKKGPPPLRGVDVLVVDEANLTEDRDRAALYQHAADTGTRIVEIGDSKQLRGVGVGSLFARVHEIVGGAELRDNRRQRDEDERAAIAAWREGRYTESLSVWSGKARLVATETGDEATTAMLAQWWELRQGATDGHTEMRGLVMLAATNNQVERINQAAQALRLTEGELGAGRTYDVAGGEQLLLHVGDHVMLRVNDRAKELVDGEAVLNGYRAIVTAIDRRGTLTTQWQQENADGQLETKTAKLSPTYVAIGGVELAYAMTVHKSEGLTVKDQWLTPDGTASGATVLFHVAGADNPAAHVATSRHRGSVYIFAGRDEVETEQDTYLRGVPRTYAELVDRIVEKLAEHARDTEEHGDDRPVVVDLGLAEFAAEDGERTLAAAVREAEHREQQRLREEQRAEWHAEKQARAEHRAHRQQVLQQREQARKHREQTAAELLRDVWRHEPALVERIITAAAFATIARNLADAAEAGYDPREVLAEIPLGLLGSDRVRDAAAYTATAIDHAVERLRSGEPTAADRAADRQHAHAERELLRDQATDLLREAWTARPALAEAIIDSGAFTTIVRDLDRYTEAGLDIRQVLGTVPLARIDRDHIRDKGAYATYALRRVAERALHELEQDREQAAHNAARAQRHAGAAAVLRTAWHDHPAAADHVINSRAFPALADRMEAARDNGYDVEALLTELDADTLTSPSVISPAGATTFAFGRAVDRAEPRDIAPTGPDIEVPADTERTAAHTLDTTTEPAPELEAQPGAEPAEPEPPAAAHWSARPFGELADDALDRLAESEQRRASRLAAERTAAAAAATRHAQDIALGRGPEVTAAEANLTRLREHAAAIEHAEQLETQWSVLTGRAITAAQDRTLAEQEHDQLGRLATRRRAELDQRIATLRVHEEQLQHETADLAELAANVQRHAGPRDQRRHILTRARAAEQDHPHAREAAQRRDHEAGAALQRRADRALEAHQRHQPHLEAIHGEQRIRQQLPEHARDAEQLERHTSPDLAEATIAPRLSTPTPAGPELTAPQALTDPEILHAHELPPPETGGLER